MISEEEEEEEEKEQVSSVVYPKTINHIAVSVPDLDERINGTKKCLDLI